MTFLGVKIKLTDVTKGSVGKVWVEQVRWKGSNRQQQMLIDTNKNDESVQVINVFC